jgi:hypothetical protein
MISFLIRFERKYIMIMLATFCSLSMNAQSTLDYVDFHLEQSPGNPLQNTIMLQTNYIVIDTTSYQNYTLTSNSSCTYGSMNSLAYYAVNPTAPSGFEASNIYITYQVPARHYYISNLIGVYDNGYDFSYYEPCQFNPVFYIEQREEFNDPLTMVEYPISIGDFFTDSAYSAYIQGQGGCIDPYDINSEIFSTLSAVVTGKVLNTGGLITPCASYDSVYFIRRIIVADEQRTVHTTGIDSLSWIDTTYYESYRIKTTNTIGILKGHPYFLFDQKIIERTKYFPDTLQTSDTVAWFYYRDPLLSILENQSSETAIMLSPNPTNGQIRLYLPAEFVAPETIEIFNSLGQLRSRQEFQPMLDLSPYPDGLYFVVVSSANGERVAGRAVKQ